MPIIRAFQYAKVQLQGRFQPLPRRQDERKLLVFRKIVPNSLTLLAVAVGLTAVPLAMGPRPRWEAAVVCILLASVLDGLDGPVARLLKGTSRFGAELDSLCDLINFGVAPALVIYLWRLHRWEVAGWMVALMWVMCTASRLARFNAGVDFNQGLWSRNYFAGVPAPAGALLALAPLALEFRFGTAAVAPFVDRQWPLFAYYALISFLLVSNWPTFSSKMINRTLLPRCPLHVAAALCLLAVVLYLVMWDAWAMGLFAVAGYLASFPISFLFFVRLQAANRP